MYEIGLLKSIGNSTHFGEQVYLSSGFWSDSKIRAEIGRKTANKIQRVEKELAWEKEKHQLGLKKLQNR